MSDRRYRHPFNAPTMALAALMWAVIIVAVLWGLGVL